MINFKHLTAAVFTLAFLLGPTPAWAASLSLSPSSGTFNRSCSFSLDVNLDTQGVQSDGTDAVILYDNSRITATSVTPGTIYAEYPGTNVDDASGKISISGLAAVSQAFTGQGKLATINFAVKDNAPTGATQVKFDFDPGNMTKTTDSNVVQRGTAQDTLSSVVNGNYTIGTGTCTTAPGGTTPGGTIVTPGGKGAPIFISTPSAEQKQFKTLPPAGGNAQWTAALAIFGATLTVLGVLGLALL